MNRENISDVVGRKCVFNSLVFTTVLFSGVYSSASQDLSDIKALHNDEADFSEVLQNSTVQDKIYGGQELQANDPLAKVTIGIEAATVVNDDDEGEEAGSNQWSKLLLGGLRVGAWLTQETTLDPVTEMLTNDLKVDSNSGQKLEISRCSGTLLDNDLVVTAAHCLGDRMAIIFGNNMNITNLIFTKVDAATRSKPFPIDDEVGQIMHQGGDVALLHFPGGPLNGYQATTLLTQPDQPKAGESITVAGYGVSRIGAKDSGVLKRTDLTVKGYFPVSSMVELIQTDATGICSGDSGGPAYATRNDKRLFWGVTNAVAGRFPPQQTAIFNGGHAQPSGAIKPCGDISIYTDVTAPRYVQFLKDAAVQLRTAATQPSAGSLKQ